MFKWVGPLTATKVSLVALKKKNIKINSWSDLGKYRIGVIKDDIGETLLLQNGVSDANFQRVSKPSLNVKKIQKDRIDLMAYEENVTKWVIKNEGFNPDDFETVKVLKEAELYIAFNKNTSDDLIKKCQKILDEMKEDGSYKKIVAKYLK